MANSGRSDPQHVVLVFHAELDYHELCRQMYATPKDLRHTGSSSQTDDKSGNSSKERSMSSKDSMAPEELRLGDLLRRLRVSHAWAMIGVAFGLLAGSFTLGYKAHTWVSDVGARREVISKAKHEFFTRYNRYITARDRLKASFSSETEKELQLAEKMLFDLVKDWWTKQEDFSGTMSFQPEVIRKGFDPTKSLVVFADGAEFVIPPEIKQKVIESEQ